MALDQGSVGRSSARTVESLLGFDRSNFYLGDEGQIIAQVGVTSVAGGPGASSLLSSVFRVGNQFTSRNKSSQEQSNAI